MGMVGGMPHILRGEPETPIVFDRMQMLEQHPHAAATVLAGRVGPSLRWDGTRIIVHHAWVWPVPTDPIIPPDRRRTSAEVARDWKHRPGPAPYAGPWCCDGPGSELDAGAGTDEAFCVFTGPVQGPDEMTMRGVIIV